jgi:CheY-like chemotaxis protein
MNVLIADDEPMTRSLLRRILAKEFDCTVSEAKDGLEALSVAGSRPTNLIITDLKMPLMDGIELLEALRQFPPLAGVPVVMMTAARETGPVHRAIELGVTDYLLKPLQASRVSERLRSIIDKLKQQTKDNELSGGRRVDVDDRTAVLIADGSADFRQFVASTLGAGRTVHEAATGVAALQRCVESRPGLVCIGGELGVLGPELLMRKLRTTPDLAATRIVAVVPKQALDRPFPPGLHDGILTRTFVADDFRQQFHRLIARAKKAEDVLAAHPQLRLQVASAAEQVFGMMLQLEVELSFEVVPRPVSELVVATLSLDLPDRAEAVTMALRTDGASAARIAAGIRASEVALKADSPEAAVAEVLQIVAGRTRTALEDTGVRAVMGTAASTTHGAGDLAGAADGAVQLTVRTADAAIQFVLQLSAAPATVNPVIGAVANLPAAALPA